MDNGSKTGLVRKSMAISRRAFAAIAGMALGGSPRAISATGRIQSVIGTGTPGSGAGEMANPYGISIGPDGALYICEIDNHVIRRLDLRTKAITTVAGNGVGSSDARPKNGEGGPATEAALNQPYEVRFDTEGNLYFVDMPNHLVRRVDAKTGTIRTVAGTGEPGFSGDGGPAADARLRQPHSIAFDMAGRLLICDIGNHRVRRVDLDSGRIETWLGTGQKAATPMDRDGTAPIAGTPFFGPRAIDFDRDGIAYLALREGNAVYAIDEARQRVRHIAGTGEKGYSGDGGPARTATLNGPKGISLGPNGLLYLADTENHVIRRIRLRIGVIDTAAGSGELGDGPDGDPLQCRMNRPHGVFAAADGTVYIGDSEAHRVRALRP